MERERTKQIITDMKELLSDPDHWTKGAYARYGKDQAPIWPNHRSAKCFCLGGALIRLTRNTIECTAVADLLRGQIRHGKKYYTIPLFNDAPETTHEDVIGVLDKALETI